ncbi:radical SAM protein [candidate division WOR-3 bacterium]|nr:radical SAM protein [candidate division WOR-3 bacterium]MCK4756163.1 radical SAM protein [candidate division WOR-3 bacterium]
MRKITKELIDEFYNLLSPCRICPRECKVDRLKREVGNCKAGLEVKISSYHQHFGEEPPLVGKHGSGTIFFTHCNLHCVYCQNYEISQLGMGRQVILEELARMMLRLQNLGCHNINFVTPTPWVPQIIKALIIAQEKGLNIPIVYNCGGYESVETLKLLEGIVDIYMPDIKYADNECAEKYSGVQEYWDVVRPALKEMHSQVGDLVVENGIAKKGLLIRHLVLPNNITGSKKCFEFISQELSKNTVVNPMAQYYPTFKADQSQEINRRITAQEYQQVLADLEKYGLDKGFKQTIDTIFRSVVPEWTDNLKNTN